MFLQRFGCIKSMALHERRCPVSWSSAWCKIHLYKLVSGVVENAVHRIVFLSESYCISVCGLAGSCTSYMNGSRMFVIVRIRLNHCLHLVSGNSRVMIAWSYRISV